MLSKFFILGVAELCTTEPQKEDDKLSAVKPEEMKTEELAIQKENRFEKCLRLVLSFFVNTISLK